MKQRYEPPLEDLFRAIEVEAYLASQKSNPWPHFTKIVAAVYVIAARRAASSGQVLLPMRSEKRKEVK